WQSGGTPADQKQSRAVLPEGPQLRVPEEKGQTERPEKDQKSTKEIRCSASVDHGALPSGFGIALGFSHRPLGQQRTRASAGDDPVLAKKCARGRGCGLCRL